MGKSFVPPPSMHVQLDAYSKKQLRQIQKVLNNARGLAILTSTIDIMTVFTKKPLKTVKKIYKKDWDTFIARIEGLKSMTKDTCWRLCDNAIDKYSKNSELYMFWEGLRDAFAR